MKLKTGIGLALCIVLIAAGISFWLQKNQQIDKIENIQYGDKLEQKLDIYMPQRIPIGKKLPVILYVHGGGWTGGNKENVAEKPNFFIKKGYVFISINHRLSPKATYEEMASDVALAIKWVDSHAGEYQLDRRKINLMGHSAGGHLIMLVGTNPKYLQKAGLSPQSIHSIVNLEGPVDLVEFIQWLGSYKKVFGADPKVWKQASPLAYAAEKNLPPMLLVTRRAASVAGFVKRTQLAGNRVEVFESKTLTHSEVTKLLGDSHASGEAKEMTSAVETFLKDKN
ncbi:alpha/beta hydrolase fold domain-containing protein [Neobacillus sp. SM06]|uniref:alpha/beta hydrolase fold domain-containing protein n=1 Tax=Neobacillus sp. SM06 TaxID=3422492 RepID=UPI003D2B01E6